MSQVLYFLRSVRNHCCDTGGFSWAVVNAANHDALRLAISARMKWEPEDVVNLRKWCGKGVSWAGFTERDYAYAIKCGNLSAARAFERAQGRKPFLYAHTGKTAKERLCLGASFWWGCAQIGAPSRSKLEVTSFADDGKSLIACEYGPYESGKPRRPIRRVTITLQDLAAWAKSRKMAREAKKLADAPEQGDE